MPHTHALTVLMPDGAGQKWACHSCGDCCRTLVGHLFPAERERIDAQNWRETLGTEPYVSVGRGHVLNKSADGACVFLDENNRCRIHARFGEAAKPLACRIFPFSARPVAEGWQISFRYDCPSAARSKGQPLHTYRAWLAKLLEELPREGSIGEEIALLGRGARATREELEITDGRVTRWLKRGEIALSGRVIAAARLTALLSAAQLKTVRGSRYAELVDVLVGVLPGQLSDPAGCCTARHRAMLRQLAFTHAEHVTLGELRSGWFGRLWKRMQQLRKARRFLKGTGVVPPVPGIAGRSVSFAAVEAVRPSPDGDRAITHLVTRYLLTRIAGRTIHGTGYYGWPVFDGYAALWLSVGAIGWLARCSAAGRGVEVIDFEDAERAVAIVDRAATRVPSLGTTAERLRTTWLRRDEGIPALLDAYALVEPRPSAGTSSAQVPSPS